MALKNTFKICVMAGDGIGPEVIGCARRVLDSLASSVDGPSFAYDEQMVGADQHERTGQSITEAAVDAAKAADAVLLGAMDVARLPPGATQPLRTMRQGLDVGASVRPSRSFDGLPSPCGKIDTVVVREVTEGIYSGIEYMAGPDAACSVRLITREKSTRTAEIAFAQARQRRRKVTAIHKLGGLKLTDGLFIECCQAVADKYPDITFETRNVDACAMELVRHPGDFDVILTTNTFGDILSDVAAGVGCGLGLAPSGCIGARWAYFEPVHGTAPDIAGKGIANPMAAILSAAMMVRHLGHGEAAGAIERAVEQVLAAGTVRTGDIGGRATSTEVTDAIIGALGA